MFFYGERDEFGTGYQHVGYHFATPKENLTHDLVELGLALTKDGPRKLSEAPAELLDLSKYPSLQSHPSLKRNAVESVKESVEGLAGVPGVIQQLSSRLDKTLERGKRFMLNFQNPALVRAYPTRYVPFHSDSPDPNQPRYSDIEFSRVPYIDNGIAIRYIA